MRPLWKKAAALGFLAFLGLWVAGTIYGMTPSYSPPLASPLPASVEYSARLPLANNLKQIGLGHTPLPLVLDQPEVEKIRVHEKRAELAAGTVAYDDDEARIRAALTAHQATLFNDRKGGIAPKRSLVLEIGVPPDRFDTLVEQLRTIAHLESVGVQQQDRTGEFRRLYAQRQSLKKYLESVLKLRGARNPSIDDALKLEQKIQDIEKELQTLGVQFGDLLGKESFYHVHLTLSEVAPGSTYVLAQRLGHGFLWGLAWWSGLALLGGVVAATCLSVQTLWPRRAVVGTERRRETTPT